MTKVINNTTTLLILVVGALILSRPAGLAHSNLHLARADDTGDRRGGDDHRLKDCLRSKGERQDRGKESRNGEDCLPIGSSSGVARGDFNGDRVGDLGATSTETTSRTLPSASLSKRPMAQIRGE
jgi:hypothetical protein